MSGIKEISAYKNIEKGQRDIEMRDENMKEGIKSKND